MYVEAIIMLVFGLCFLLGGLAFGLRNEFVNMKKNETEEDNLDAEE